MGYNITACSPARLITLACTAVSNNNAVLAALATWLILTSYKTTIQQHDNHALTRQNGQQPGPTKAEKILQRFSSWILLEQNEDNGMIFVFYTLVYYNVIIQQIMGGF